MENSYSNQKTESRNPENRRGFLRFWKSTLAQNAGKTAIFSAQGEKLRTFAEVEEDALLWAARFNNLPQGAVVAVQTGNVPEVPALLLGIWYAERIALPLDMDLADDRREAVESLCGVALHIGRDLVPRKLRHPIVDWPQPEPVLLKLTSGTSAAPRVVRFTARQLIADCTAICATMGLREDDINYGVISFAHSYGLSNLISPLICQGIPLVVASDLMPQAVRQGLAASRATVFPGVPALFRALSGIAPGELALRLCISAGAPLTLEIADSFRARWGRKIHSFYGSSECGGICYDATEEIVMGHGFVGQPMQGVNLKPLSEDWPAQIEVRGDAVGQGYFPAAEDDELRDGIFRPADLLAPHADGYIITGRLSDVINVGGRKVNPGEIETALLRCPGVREAMVVGLPCGFRGQEIAACVAGQVTEDELRQFCGQALPAWQIPRRWAVVESIPVNARGKTSRQAIRDLF